MANTKVSRRKVLAGSAASVALANTVGGAGHSGGDDGAAEDRASSTRSAAPPPRPANGTSPASTSHIEQAKGMFAGRKVEIIQEDDQFNPQVGLEKCAVRRERPGRLITGIQGSNIAMAVLTTSSTSKAFVILSGAGTDAP